MGGRGTGQTQVSAGGHQRPVHQMPGPPHTFPHSSPRRGAGSGRAFLAKVCSPFLGSPALLDGPGVG